MLAVNMDDSVKREFTEVVNQLGMNPTTAVNLFARTVIRERGLPVPLTLRTSDEQEWKDYRARQLRRGIESVADGDMMTVVQAKQALDFERAADE